MHIRITNSIRPRGSPGNPFLSLPRENQSPTLQLLTILGLFTELRGTTFHHISILPSKHLHNFKLILIPMAPAISSSEASSTARKLVRINGSFRRRTSASRRLSPSPSPPPKKFKPIDDIMARASHVVLKKKRADYSNIRCEQCGYGDQPDELLLCDKCDNGFHMKCVRPIVVRVPIGSWLCPKCSGERRVRSRGFAVFDRQLLDCYIFVVVIVGITKHLFLR